VKCNDNASCDGTTMIVVR